MPRTPRPWFRFYSEAIDNPKLQRLDPEHFKLYINLLCLANQGVPRGVLPRPADIAFRLRIDLDLALRQLQELRARKLLDGPFSAYRIHDWVEWQPDSDANQTPGRKDRNAKRTGKERATSEIRTPREEREEERDTEEKKEGEENARAPEHPFTLAYVKHWQEGHAANSPSPIRHGEIIALEKEHGSDRCFQAAGERGWDKPAAYYREWLIDPNNTKEARNNGRAKALVGASSRGATRVLTNDDLDDLERYKRGEVD